MAEEHATRMYLVYDEQALRMPVEDATLLEATPDLEDAKAYARAHNGVVYAYTLNAEGELINGERVYYEPDQP